MILKKEHISNGKIRCYLSLNSKISKIIIGNKTYDMDLSSAKEIKPSNEYDIASNFLLRINKLLSNLKNQDDNFINSEITIIVDNKIVEKIIKPEGVIIKKPSKDFKKSVDNQRLKAMLGITLQELSNFKNIDLMFENFSNKEETIMNNNNFNYLEEEDNFEIDIDISGLNDMMNVSNIDSLNYDENDLFKEFDLNTDSLFNGSSTDTFVFEDETISALEDDFQINEDSFKNIEINNEKSLDLIYNDNTEDKSQANEKPVFDNDNFSISDDFIIGDDDFIEENFTLNLEENSVNDSDTKETLEELVYNNNIHTIYPKETMSSNEEVLYSSQEEPINNIEKNNSEYHSEKENDVVYDTNDVIYDIKKEDVDIHLVEEDTFITSEENITPIISEEVTMYIAEDDIKFKPTEPSSLKIEKTSENVIETYTHTETKEDTTMNEKNIKHNKTLDINDKFIQNELVELKNLLNSKANSYRSRFNQMNAKYEEKHSALKDLNLTDEKEQLEIFKEFLACKSTMVNLKTLDDTCMSIISDIEDKISNIRK